MKKRAVYTAIVIIWLAMPVYLARHVCLPGHHQLHEFRHRRRNVHTLGRLQQLRRREGHHSLSLHHHIPHADDTHDLLLLHNCLLTQTTGIRNVQV